MQREKKTGSKNYTILISLENSLRFRLKMAAIATNTTVKEFASRAIDAEIKKSLGICLKVLYAESSANTRASVTAAKYSAREKYLARRAKDELDLDKAVRFAINAKKPAKRKIQKRKSAKKAIEVARVVEVPVMDV